MYYTLQKVYKWLLNKNTKQKCHRGPEIEKIVQQIPVALCLFFTILVSLSRDNALFASKAKINVFWKNFEWSGSIGASAEKKFQITLILVFEVIAQPPKAHFLTFSSEIKIMKITHSAKAMPIWTFCPTSNQLFKNWPFSL